MAVSFHGGLKGTSLWPQWLSKRYLHFNHGYRLRNSASNNKLQRDTLYRPGLERDACGVGMIANLNQDYNRKLIVDANTMLRNMSHRGGCGLDERCGDGAGMLTNIPHSFFANTVTGLPSSGAYGVGNVFFGKDTVLNTKIKSLMTRIIEDEFGFAIVCFRPIPTESSILGQASKDTEPIAEQLFIANTSELSQDAFERRLLLLRNVIAKRVEQELSLPREYYYVCSLSSKTLTYKGQLTPEQLMPYFIDLQHDDFRSNFALVHSRFSTNTSPSWDRAQPNRVSCHNGEINTLRGNKNWMHSRSGLARSGHFGDDTPALFPICSESMTDSGNFDAVLETLTKGSGSDVNDSRSLPEVVISMIPEAWQNDAQMSAEKRAMYEYLSCTHEPWDGPALIAFADGNYAGAVLDRNGLRPSRYYVTDDGHVLFSSEVGVLPDVDQASVVEKGRLEPGKIFLIDLNGRRIVRDAEFKDSVASSRPFRQWLDTELISLNDLQRNDASARREFSIASEDDLTALNCSLNSFGFTAEMMELLLVPMMVSSKEPLGSMGNDASLAVLSAKPKLPGEYFKQLFAQVTNPPIDPIREAFVMTLKCPVGPERNVFEKSEKHCQRLTIDTPVLSEEQMDVLKNVKDGPWTSLTLDCTFPANTPTGKDALLGRLDELCAEAEKAISKNNVPIIVLTNRSASPKRCAIPSLLSIGAVHHHLVQKQLRVNVALMIEAGDAKEVHDFCTLIGYGADGVCPYSVYNIISKMHYEDHAELKELSKAEAVASYTSAISKGIKKVMSKMGISTMQSYKGAQVFEAIGLHEEVIEKCFRGTESRIQGSNFDVLYTDIQRLHEYGYGFHTASSFTLRNAGDYHFRIKQEEHFNTPETITALQTAVRTENQDSYNVYSEMSNLQSAKVTLRGLLKFNRPHDTESVPLEEVEPISRIMRRFATGAMSLGSISKETHETLAEAMNFIGGRSNTGEGGEDPVRFENNQRSAIKQVASGRFGVTINYLSNADQIQIKMAQGAKPGEGGELPGAKVTDYIGHIRHTTPGVGLISPPPHHDIYSIEDLAQLIFDLRQCAPTASISVKLVSEIGVGIVAAGVAKAKADHILISGHDGGTGASAWTGIKNGGVPWEYGIAEVQQNLVANGLRDRVTVQTDGQLKTGRDVVVAALLGAEEFGFGTAPLIAMGCIMMRKCHLNTCPVGIATQDPLLRAKFEGLPEHAVNFFYFLAAEVRGYMAALGVRSLDELIGRTDLLTVDPSKVNYKSRNLDLSPLLTEAENVHGRSHDQVHRNEASGYARETSGVDEVLLAMPEITAAIEKESKSAVSIEYPTPLLNLNRTVGATLSNAIAKRHGDDGLSEGAISVTFRGYGGQSFGCGLIKGVSFVLEGDANDFVGKMLSGGEIAVFPPRDVGFAREEAARQTIAGNACLYGATAGKAFFSGSAGERFAVRNSGAEAVVEGVGDHACEYMTGGRVVILGEVGKNAFAGMSGGIAYIFKLGDAAKMANLEMVALEELEDEDVQFVHKMLKEHVQLTGSYRGEEILKAFDANQGYFTKVMPHDYKRVLQQQRMQKVEIEC